MTEDTESTELVPVVEDDAKVRVSLRTAIQKAELHVAANLPKYLGKLEELADGVVVMETKGDGEPSVYVVPPDRASLEYLIDRVMGKPPQRYEVTGDEGGPVRFIPWLPSQDSDGDGDDDVIDADAMEVP